MARTRAALEWKPTDETTDGRFYIHSEHPRGEPRYYWLECQDSATRAAHAALGLAGDGSFDKRKVKRLAQRIADAVDNSA